MLSDTEASGLSIALAVCLKKKEKKKCRWTKEWLKKRNKCTHENLLRDLWVSEPSDFQNFLWLDATSFDELLIRIAPWIEKMNTTSKPAFVVRTTLPCYWKYFWRLKIHKYYITPIIGIIVMEICTALIHILHDYIKPRSGFGGLVVSILASGTEIRRFGRKNPQHAFLWRGSKAVGPRS
jgi:hypothetical protein